MKIRKAHCLFEQSGTFKNEFIKLGIPAEDYDIQNAFSQTDNVIDLYGQIGGAYDGDPSIFDNMTSDDIVMAFFPCIRFENQILLWFRGEAIQQKKLNDIEKLEKDIELHRELHENYELISKLAIICLRKNLRLIIENPYSEQHHLTRYWCLRPAIIDKDRTERGDSFTKPTQYWFLNCKAENNVIFEPLDYVEHISLKKDTWGTSAKAKAERSMIQPQYANRFIREFILDENKTKE